LPISSAEGLPALKKIKKKREIERKDGKERRIGEPFHQKHGKVHLGRYGGNAP
jgi:hypothetical protein